MEDVVVKQNASFSTELKLAYDIEAKGLVSRIALVGVRINNERKEEANPILI